jgi:hypothetical protein
MGDRKRCNDGGTHTTIEFQESGRTRTCRDPALSFSGRSSEGRRVDLDLSWCKIDPPFILTLVLVSDELRSRKGKYARK